MTESSLTTMAPLLLRKIITSIFISADSSLLNLGERYKLLQYLRHLLVYSFLFCLRLLPSFFPCLNHPSPSGYPLKPTKGDLNPVLKGADSSIARALSQLLSIMNEIPVSSRKYEVVRSLAEKLIDDNLKDGFQILRDVNRGVISAALSRTLVQLEAAVLKRERERERERERVDGVSGTRPLDYGLIRVLRAVRSFGDVARSRLGGSWAKDEVSILGGSAEKLASELLWLAQKLTDCECAEEAVWRWGSASSLAWLALSAEPRVQGLLVRISAFLFKQAKEMVKGEEECEEGKKEEIRQMRMKILMSWLPLMCHASRGAEAPVLNRSERVEMERVLDETIQMLEREEQEKVLSLWLHHFTCSSSSDWPNLQACFTRWCNASRKILLVQ